MSLTSYRAAPPRGGEGVVNGFLVACSRASMPGDDLLFHRLSDSTIGAVGFHGRVRDGIGWDTDAMATRQWSLRACVVLGIIDACTVVHVQSGWEHYIHAIIGPGLMVGVWSSQARPEQLGPVSSMRYRTSTSGLSRSWSSTALDEILSRGRLPA